MLQISLTCPCLRRPCCPCSLSGHCNFTAVKTRTSTKREKWDTNFSLWNFYVLKCEILHSTVTPLGGLWHQTDLNIVQEWVSMNVTAGGQQCCLTEIHNHSLAPRSGGPAGSLLGMCWGPADPKSHKLAEDLKMGSRKPQVNLPPSDSIKITFSPKPHM